MRPLPDLGRALAAAALLLALLHGCGGSGGVDSGGTGGTLPTLAQGPISGFGSIVVAGVHYDESRAELLDADGAPVPASALALGAVVRIDASAVTTSGTRADAVARTVRTQEAVIGPVEAVDAAAGTLRVLGQAVAVNGGTFDAGPFTAWQVKGFEIAVSGGKR